MRRLISDWNDAFAAWSLQVQELHECRDGDRLAIGRPVLRGGVA